MALGFSSPLNNSHKPLLVECFAVCQRYAPPAGFLPEQLDEFLEEASESTLSSPASATDPNTVVGVATSSSDGELSAVVAFAQSMFLDFGDTCNAGFCLRRTTVVCSY